MAKSRSKSKKPRHILRKIILTLVLIVALGLGGLYAYDKLQQEYTVTYDTYTATVGTISNSLSFSGTLQLIDSKTYTVSSSTGVRALYVTEGQAVKKGDRLLTLTNGKTFTADFDGRVNVINVAVGDDVSNGEELLQIADFDHLKVSIRVDEYDISDVTVGESCRITTTATDQEYESTIASINYISSSTGSVAYYTATSYVDVRDGIYPGMQVTVTIPQEEASNVVILKMDALSFDETNRAFVYQMGAGEELTPVYVETGVSNGNYVEIKSGLQANDTVYVAAKSAAASTMTSLFSSMFGGQRINPGTNNGFRNNTNRQNGNAPGGNYGGGGGQR
ncbi:MAG: HlyD family efflux transporter periplasmic adaptor subunit [Clostridia bacterium]|nr:HlyD family efflux transporter periplasmic adaptor subunit [Clostridia bacterium]